MRYVIYKYGPFTISNTVEYEGTPVHVGYQDYAPAPYPDYRIYMWCKLVIDGDNPKGKTHIVATGEEYNTQYYGTVVMPSGVVWHIVEV